MFSSDPESKTKIIRWCIEGCWRKSNRCAARILTATFCEINQSFQVSERNRNLLWYSSWTAICLCSALHRKSIITSLTAEKRDKNWAAAATISNQFVWILSAAAWQLWNAEKQVKEKCYRTKTHSRTFFCLRHRAFSWPEVESTTCFAFCLTWTESPQFSSSKHCNTPGVNTGVFPNSALRVLIVSRLQVTAAQIKP